MSKTEAISNKNLNQNESKTSLSELEHMSSIESEHLLHSQSESSMFSKKIVGNRLISNSTKTNHNSVDTYFPIAHVYKDSPIVNNTLLSLSYQLPTIPKQVGTFIYRLLTRIFLLKNTKKVNKNKSYPIKQIKRKRINRKLNATVISNDNNAISNRISPRKQRQQKYSTAIAKNNRSCHVCRKYRNSFSMTPISEIQILPEDVPSESHHTINTNATMIPKDHSLLMSESLVSLPRARFKKVRTFNGSKYKMIASAMEFIFDSFISNYQYV